MSLVFSRHDQCLRYSRSVTNPLIYSTDNATETKLGQLLGYCLRQLNTITPSVSACIGQMNYRVYELSLRSQTPRLHNSLLHVSLSELYFPTIVRGLLFVGVKRRKGNVCHAARSHNTDGPGNDTNATFAAMRTPSRIQVVRLLHFYQWMGLMVLSQPEWHLVYGTFQNPIPRRPSPFVDSMDLHYLETARKLCVVFETYLLFRAVTNDHWLHRGGGKGLFLKKLAWFVGHGCQLRFCLPAFPCKSSNHQKTADWLPNGGEYESLNHLYEFCHRVKAIYEPGCMIDIVSDGHVFSDCIGVDDEIVNTYSQHLRAMSNSLFKARCSCALSHGPNPLQFHGLNSLVFPDGNVRSFWGLVASDFVVFHPLPTKRSIADNICRRILMQSHGMAPEQIRNTIRTDPDHSLTKLYRGFSKFMFEDLAISRAMQDKSKKQRKRLAETVAFEMMRRNQAYSSLVELLMPRHIRLSIHAHNNNGPKFAISLLPSTRFRLLESFDSGSLRSSQRTCQNHHLHIPTPWHNALVEIQGHSWIYIVKAHVVESELRRVDSPWDKSSGYVSTHPEGGRFVLRYKTVSTT